jgi:hypothetical protein
MFNNKPNELLRPDFKITYRNSRLAERREYVNIHENFWQPRIPHRSTSRATLLTLTNVNQRSSSYSSTFAEDTSIQPINIDHLLYVIIIHNNTDGLC